jgi:uncharacterized repeat protein (TIGR02543 family)
MMNKKLFRGLMALGLLSAMITAPSAAARSTNNPPLKNPIAQHTSSLAGTINYDASNTTTDKVEGTVNLVVDQTGVTGSIVYANINLPSGFTWGGDETVTVTSREDDGGEVEGWTASSSGATLSISGLTLSDTTADADTTVEFTISVATNAGITTTQEATGLYGVSSQYRTNATRKIKEQTWVLSTPAMINLTVTEAITWDDEGADITSSSGGSTTYTTGQAVATVQTTPPDKTGCTFDGWFTEPLGAGMEVFDGSFTPTSYNAVTFYASWINCAT